MSYKKGKGFSLGAGKKVIGKGGKLSMKIGLNPAGSGLSRSQNESLAVLATSSADETDPLEDRELELERLIKLNYEAASGQLQSSSSSLRTSTDQSQPLLVSGTNLALRGNDVQDDLTGKDASGQSIPFPQGTVKPTNKAKANFRPKPPQIKEFAAFEQQLEIGQLGELGDDVQDMEVEEVAGMRAKYKTAPDDREAAEALVRAFQPFIAKDSEMNGDDLYPVALPVPLSGVAESSALRDLRQQMIDSHKRSQVPLPIDADVARLLSELEDGEGMHLQLPAFSFPLDERQWGSNTYVQTGVLHLRAGADSGGAKTGQAEMKAYGRDKIFHLSVAQQNLPSSNVSLFILNHPKVDEESGVVVVENAHLAASLSGTVNFQDRLVHEEIVRDKRKDLLLRISNSKQPTKPPKNKPPVVSVKLVENRKRDAEHAKMLPPSSTLPAVKKAKKAATKVSTPTSILPNINVESR